MKFLLKAIIPSVLLFTTVYADVTFTILHINDMHARVQGMRGGGGCKVEQNEAAECDGGWARLLAAGKQFVDESEHPVIFIDNGDQFSGTVWSTFYKGVEVSTFMNKLCEPRETGGAGFAYCFSGIGNHEFDFGYIPLLETARNFNHKIITSNIIDNCEANSQGEHSASELGNLFNNHVIVDIEGTDVGFIGYTITETPGISSPPRCMTFEDEAVAVEREIQFLKEQGINVIIITGHSGIDKDIEIAQQFPDVDIIVGGHTHTYLWNEEEQGPVPAQSRPRTNDDGEIVGLRKDTPRDVYPRLVGDEGNQAVVQAYFGGRYLGAIEVTFDSDGVLSSLNRSSVILANENSPVVGATTVDPLDTDPSKGYAEDEGMVELVNDLLAPLLEFENLPIGIAAIDLLTFFGDASVRTSEMPLGNIICDAMLANVNANDPDAAQICMQNGGGIRAPIETGIISFGTVIEVHPFSNVLAILEFTGQRVHEAVEHGLSRVGSGRGEFLQFGKGFELVYDPRLDPGSRVVSIKLNGETIEKDESQTYKVVTNSFIAAGGDNYGSIMTDAPVILESGEPQEDALANYLRENCPTCFEVEGRIIPVVNPVDTEGNEVDVLGTIFESCEDVDFSNCTLDDDDDDDDDGGSNDDDDDDDNDDLEISVGLLVIVVLAGIVFILAAILLFALCYMRKGNSVPSSPENEDFKAANPMKLAQG